MISLNARRILPLLLLLLFLGASCSSTGKAKRKYKRKCRECPGFGERSDTLYLSPDAFAPSNG